MNILVIAEHNHSTLHPSTLSTITAAKQLGQAIDVLVAGKSCADAAKDASSIDGVSNVLVADHEIYEHFLAENMSTLVHSHAGNYQYILTPSGTFGKNLLPRIAALLDVAQITDVIEIVSPDTFKRPIYAGNAIATVQSKDSCKCLTIRSTAFEKANNTDQTATITTLDAGSDAGLSGFVSMKRSESDRPDLTTARVVVSGGRGMESGDNFALLENLASHIDGCAIGASRAAVDAGFVPNDYQVGQTGKIVAPELYIAFGISGAIQHLAGMKDSKVIVAVNTDENAPIFDVADIGIVADLFDVIPKIESLISS